MNATIKAIIATIASIGIMAVLAWLIADSRTQYINNRERLMQKEIDAYKESIILTGKACKLDVAQLRYELRQAQEENAKLKNAKEQK